MQKVPNANCDACPLKDKPIAKTVGPENSDTILVSRSPGFSEAMSNSSFSGPSGKVLDYFLKLNGITRRDIRLTNVVLCAPDEGKLPKEAIAACSGRLKHELDSASLIIAAGAEAVKEVLGSSITSARGYAHERYVDGKTQRVIATNNPALVLRDDSTFPNLKKDFRLAFNPMPKPTMPSVNVVDNVDEAKRLLGLALASKSEIEYCAADIESRGGISQFAELVTMQFAMTPYHATTFGIHVTSNDDWIDNYLKPFLESDVSFIWHNGKFDTQILQNYGISARVDEDTLLLSYALDERPGVHGLDYILMDELGWPNYEPDSVKAFKKTGILEEPAELYYYAGLDASGTRSVFNIFRERAIDTGVWDWPYKNHFLANHDTLVHIEQAGIVYDVDKAADIVEEEVDPELHIKLARMREIVANPIFNPRSNPELKHLVYDTWGVKHPQQSRPDKEFSVDTEARKEIMEERFTTALDRQKRPNPALRNTIIEFATELDRYKKLDKQRSNYLVGLIEKAIIDARQQNRVYTSLLMHGTESGRLSSRKPNLQNITRDKEGLPSIRKLFRASPGRFIVSADYSQAELRAIAVHSGDRALTEIYSDVTNSFHKITAAKFYGADYDNEQYTKAKNINFGIFYGQSAYSFAGMYRMDQSEAQKYIDFMWESFPGVKKWAKDIHQQVRSVGTFTSSFGRKRRFYLITDENRDHAEKEAVNFLTQSDASDLTLVSATHILKEIDRNRASLSILVHDAIVADVDESYVPEYETITRQIMESSAYDRLGWTLPFVVDIGFGPTWGDTK